MTKRLSIQGHRGARGYFPENTIAGFLAAVEMGVNGLEMDVVISKDRQVVVSHEPWMNDRFCVRPDGMPVEKESNERYNLYHHSYAEIARFDCGINGNPDFPDQKKISASKPLLREVISAVEKFLEKNNRPGITYNIEIKSEPQLYGTFQPEPAEFSELVLSEVYRYSIKGDFYISSFDPAILREVKKKYPEVHLGFLTENKPSLTNDLAELGFKPEIYSPYFRHIDADLVRQLHQLNILLITWTVNETSDMQSLISMGLDGIITDFPDRLVKLAKTA